MPQARPLEVKFWEKVKKSDGCWLWTASLSAGRYGEMNDRKRGHIKAHRLSWELHNGSIPDGLEVCHKCDNTLCVRPDHLFLGSHDDNMQDMMRKGRHRVVPKYGSSNPMAKLTESQVAEIRRLYDSDGVHTKAYSGDFSQSKLAKRFGVSRAAISLIVERKVWA